MYMHEVSMEVEITQVNNYLILIAVHSGLKHGALYPNFFLNLLYNMLSGHFRGIRNGWN
jgi:hypothetical protein